MRAWERAVNARLRRGGRRARRGPQGAKQRHAPAGRHSRPLRFCMASPRMGVSGLRKHKKNDRTFYFYEFRRCLIWNLSTEEIMVSNLRRLTCPRSPNAKPHPSDSFCDLSCALGSLEPGIIIRSDFLLKLWAGDLSVCRLAQQHAFIHRETLAGELFLLIVTHQACETLRTD